MMTQLISVSSMNNNHLLSVLNGLLLTTNLKVCLDSGDADSYTSGQSWLDRSGNGNDFFLGATGASQASDPTFTGSAGSKDAYWELDGGDYFTYDSTNETWMESLHKDSAVFSIVCFYYHDAASDQALLLGTGVTNTDTGIALYILQSDRKTHLTIADGSGAFALSKTGDTSQSATAWHMVGVSVTEATGAGGGFFYVDGAYDQVGASDTFDSTYDTPSSSAATATLKLGAVDTTISHAGTRLACVAIWQGSVITKAQMDNIWAVMRVRFGI